MSISDKKKKIKEYYENDFDITGLKKVIDFQYFHNREFGFSPAPKRMIRNLSFDTPDDLINYMIDSAPLAVYAGAIYDSPPNPRNKTIHSLDNKGRELVFDIDLNDYDSVRKHICDCEGKAQVCNLCWQLVNVAVLIIDEAIRTDFGFTDITWVFSGRRGVHSWISDKIALTLNGDQRASIIDYLSILQGDFDKGRVVDRNKIDPEFISRIEKQVFTYFLKDITKKGLLDLQFSTSIAGNIIKQREHQDGIIDNNLINRVNKKSAEIGSYNEILRRWLPRIDRNVTIDTSRLLRVPNSIHGDTGKVARILSATEAFTLNPENEKSIYD